MTGRDQPRDPRRMGDPMTLADLITANKRDRSYRQLADLTDGQTTSAQWQRLERGAPLTDFPTAKTLRAIAWALEVDETSVVLATARSVGLDVRLSRSELAQLLPAAADRLPSDVRDGILKMVRAIVRHLPSQQSQP